MTPTSCRRRRAADPRRPGHQPAGPRLRGRPRRHRRGGAGPLAAQHHPDVVILDLGLPGIDGIEVVGGLRGWTDVRSSCCRSATTRPTRSPPSTPAPTTTSPSRSAWTSSSPGCGPSSGAARRPTRSRRRRPTHFTIDLAAKRVHRDGERRAPHAHRVAARRGARAQPGQARQPAPAPPGGVGPAVRDGDQLPAGLPGRRPPQARTRPSRPATSSPSPAWATGSSPDPP